MIWSLGYVLKFNLPGASVDGAGVVPKTQNS